MTTCYIYALIDPQTDEHFYVGSSTFPESRFLEHIRGSNTSEANHKRIKQVMKNGYKPALSILEETTEELRWEREKAWVDLLQQTGASLTNIVYVREKIGQKRIVIAVSDEFHYEIKLQAAKEGISISDKLRAMLKRWVESKGRDEDKMVAKIPTNDWIFSSNRTYIRNEIEAMASSVEETDEYLVATTPEREYWFLSDPPGYRLHHTWRGFMLAPKELS